MLASLLVDFEALDHAIDQKTEGEELGQEQVRRVINDEAHPTCAISYLQHINNETPR